VVSPICHLISCSSLKSVYNVFVIFMYPKARCKMSEKPVKFVIAIFTNEQGAEETLHALKAEKKEALQGLQAAVAMRKDADSRVHYKDVGLTPAKGAAAGMVLGAFVGVVTGGAGLALGALGGVLGGVVGKRKREGKITSEQVNQIVASIPPSSSVLLTIADQDVAEFFEAAFNEAGADTFTVDISADLAAKLDPHGEAAHKALLEQLNQ
jgi:uncharacterized membrane protein